MKKMFGPKNGTSEPQNGLSFNIYHVIEPNFEKKISLKLYHQGARISRGLKTAKKMAYGKPSSLVVEFQTKIYFLWFNIKKYVEAQAILRFGSMIFKPKHFFIIGHFIRK